MVLHHEFRVEKSGHKNSKGHNRHTKPITGHVGWQGNTYTSLYNQQEVLFHALFVEALPGLRVAPFPEAVKTKILFGRVFQPKPEPSFATIASWGPGATIDVYVFKINILYHIYIYMYIYIYCVYYTLYMYIWAHIYVWHRVDDGWIDGNGTAPKFHRWKGLFPIHRETGRTEVTRFPKYPLTK